MLFFYCAFYDDAAWEKPASKVLRGAEGGAVVEDEPGDEIEGGFVFLRLLLNQGDDEVATALEAGGELLLEGGGDRLDSGGDARGGSARCRQRR